MHRRHAVDRCPECGEFLFIYGAGGVWIDPRHFAQDAELASPAEVEALRLARERADAGEEQVGPVAWGFGVYPYRCECGTFPDPPNWHDNCGGVPF